MKYKYFGARAQQQKHWWFRPYKVDPHSSLYLSLSLSLSFATQTYLFNLTYPEIKMFSIINNNSFI